MKVQKQKGASLIITLVFSAVFLVIIGGVIGLSIQQQKLNKQKIARELALQISEAGINYAKWRLAHYPDDLSNQEKVYIDQKEHFGEIEISLK